jgi:diacylglycerol kinase (ATP)
MKNTSFVKGRIKSLKYALIGVYKLITTEHSIMVQFSIGVLASVLGFIFDITKTEWMLQSLAIGIVLAIEGLNTAVEKIADFIHPDHHEKIGFIKDIAAGAVTFAAISAVIIGMIIYIPYFTA